MLLSYLDIYGTIREHGRTSAIEAAQRADAMLDKGDLRGKAGGVDAGTECSEGVSGWVRSRNE